MVLNKFVLEVIGMDSPIVSAMERFANLRPDIVLPVKIRRVDQTEKVNFSAFWVRSNRSKKFTEVINTAFKL